jgi:co-chaperonin GroES (HSP10)
MNKKLKLQGLDGQEICTKSCPKVTSVKPVGTQVLVEFLTPQEILGTNLTLDENVQAGAPQGYIVAVGARVDMAVWGFNVGDRVLCSGAFTPCPEHNSSRITGLIEPHVIKAVLVEAK